MANSINYAEKWRETCDPFSLPYRNFTPLKILGYPHAGNDVFYMQGVYQKREVTAFVKVARQAGASIQNETAVLSQIHLPVAPVIIDYGFGEMPFSVTLELPGERLSAIVGENENLEALPYLSEYGETLAKLHRMTVSAENVTDRRFFHAPSASLLERLGLSCLQEFFADAPASRTECFCHGDFHYANVLWQDHHISGILDFELAGYGNRDFDIAWALFLRPGQKFLKSAAEQQEFLKGYAKYGEYDPAAVRYYMAQCYVYFLEFSGEDKEYCDYVRAWLNENREV